jgi:UDP-glucuronate 4-epimerase
VEGVIRVLDKPATPNPKWDGNNPDPASSTAPWRIYNIGNNRPVDLMAYIGALEKSLGTTAQKEFLPLQAGDVPETQADVRELENEFGYKPSTTVETGIANFVAWYREYFKV